ncbi:MAG: hypothetical protein NTW85_07865 [Methylococcales bacterium]|nr:hypothetical protein [Methylococcales bacterium]
MKRKHTLNDLKSVDYISLNKKTAIHEAGHAAAVYFGNKQKQLPPIFFQIMVKDCSYNHDNCIAKIEGGRLIHTLPVSLEQANSHHSAKHQYLYQQAFEADIVNLLAGSLAEAHYVARRDNELISPLLLPLSALHNYGGTDDLDTINDYLQCFIADKQQQENKLAELFLTAFDFINDYPHWYAINALADHILKNSNRIIDYSEVTTVLDKHFSAAKKHTRY